MEQISNIRLADGFKGERAVITPSDIRDYMAFNEITRQLYVTHIGYYPNAKYHLRERARGADENILICCEKGKGWIECNDKVYMLSRNEAFVIPKGKVHSYGADTGDPWSIYWIHFLGDNVRMFDSITDRHLAISESYNSRYDDRATLFESMYRNMEEGYSPENLEYVTFCFMYFLASLKYLSQFREVKSTKVDDAIQKSIRYMKDNLEGRLSLKDIALAVGYSSSRLTTLFAQKTSSSPMVYYNRLRIQKACSMLQYSDLRIKEIAYELGYYDPFHFTNSFIKEMGIPPKDYRVISRTRSGAK